MIQMEDKESVSDFFTRILKFMNFMKRCGGTLANQSILRKNLRSLSPIFDHIVVAIEESQDLVSMTLDWLQGLLEAHE